MIKDRCRTVSGQHLSRFHFFGHFPYPSFSVCVYVCIFIYALKFKTGAILVPQLFFIAIPALQTLPCHSFSLYNTLMLFQLNNYTKSITHSYAIFDEFFGHVEEGENRSGHAGGEGGEAVKAFSRCEH